MSGEHGFPVHVLIVGANAFINLMELGKEGTVTDSGRTMSTGMEMLILLAGKMALKIRFNMLNVA